MAVKKSEDAGQAEVQSVFDEANERGYFGTVPDKTPNEAYTLQGQADGAQTPETQPAPSAGDTGGEG